MRLYVEVARRTYARISTYRSATVAGVFTNTVFGFLLAYVLLAVYSQRDHGRRLRRAIDAVTFTFVAQGMLMALGLFGDTEIADRITTRRRHRRPPAALRPPGLVGAASSYGKAGYYLLFRGIPPFVAGALVFDLRRARPAPGGRPSS